MEENEEKPSAAVDPAAAAAAATEALGLKPPCHDLFSHQLKIDHFEAMHALGKENLVDGAPNFRKIIGMFKKEC